jgi:hypothetical protein
VPTYNQGQFLEARIKSIVTQSIVPSSIIVIDDNSERPYLGDFHDLVKIENKNIDFRYIINKTRNGIATKTWLQGVSLVKSKFVWIAEGDDLSKPNFVEFMVEKAKTHNLDFVTCQNLILSDGNSENFKSRHKNLFPNINWTKSFICPYETAQSKFLFLGNPIENVGGCVFRTSSLLRALNKSRNTSNLTCDWEVYLNFLPHERFGYFPEYLNVFRDHSNSQRSTTGLQKTNEQISELTIHSIFPRIKPFNSSNLIHQILINLARNNSSFVVDKFQLLFPDLLEDNQIKDRLLFVNDSSTNYFFQERIFADESTSVDSFFDVNYLIDLPLFSDSNLIAINRILRPNILFVFDILNIKLLFSNFPGASYVLFFDESDINFDDKISVASNLEFFEPIFIVFCGQNIEKIDNSFKDSSILHFSRFSHNSDKLSDFKFIEFLSFLHGIFLLQDHAKSK